MYLMSFFTNYILYNQHIADPESIPEPIKNLVGKTFAFLVCVERENIWDGKDSYRVTKLLSKDGLLAEQVTEDSADIVNSASIGSGDQVPLALTYSGSTDSSTPSSKRVYACNVDGSEQGSSSKKVCVKPMENPEDIFNRDTATLTFQENNVKEGTTEDVENDVGKKCVGEKINETEVDLKKMKGVNIKVEK
ncbi:PREDICTED: uncharacterized protein LOC104761257 [Camelina sativa]|uniref:Uncharacterized protein LOC104761257 n=1 Tax=Camelina sativa TaxID=90675 RepID=A0ABM0X9C2_CAMSA|nr:PREDICTED: uncharacterized protein LOC104761257 [Camelina sativa]XP_010482611.1 PREDICTED: uncharacterized protein LOC104761257 [Camelina sativa]XP_010482612.1 PREDICTED: uncharacterized protein LOC104761257 [Camelina sativa]